MRLERYRVTADLDEAIHAEFKTLCRRKGLTMKRYMYLLIKKEIENEQKRNHTRYT